MNVYIIDYLKLGGGGHYGHYCNDTPTHLYNSMRKYGIENFEFMILDQDPNSTEKFYIDKFDSFRNGYNNSPDGFGVESGYTAGMIRVTNGEVDRMVYPDQIPSGFHIGSSTLPGRSGKRIVYDKEGNEHLIPEDKLEEELSKHPEYTLGRNAWWTFNVTTVNNGEFEKKIPNEELDKFLSENKEFSIGRLYGATTGMYSIFDPDLGYHFMLPADDAEVYIKDHPKSYYEGGNKGKVHVTDGTINWNINSDYVEQFLKENPTFRYGHSYAPAAGRKWVTNGIERKYIYAEEVDQFLKDNPDYRLGMK